MGALDAVVWFGIGYTILRSRPRAPSAEEHRSRSWSTVRVLCSVAGTVCFIHAAAHSGEALKNSATALKSNLETSAKACSDLLVNAADFLDKLKA